MTRAYFGDSPPRIENLRMIPFRNCADSLRKIARPEEQHVDPFNRCDFVQFIHRLRIFNLHNHKSLAVRRLDIFFRINLAKTPVCVSAVERSPTDGMKTRPPGDLARFLGAHQMRNHNARRIGLQRPD